MPFFHRRNCPRWAERDLADGLRGVVCVRATSTRAARGAHGAGHSAGSPNRRRRWPFAKNSPASSSGGERDGVKIRAGQTGGIDLTSAIRPREYTPGKGRGTMFRRRRTAPVRARLHGCANGFGRLVFESHRHPHNSSAGFNQRKSCSCCAGTRENTALEDVLAAGALGEMLVNETVAQILKVGRAVPCPPPVRIELLVQQQSHGAHG